jgi:hypothetical protein
LRFVAFDDTERSMNANAPKPQRPAGEDRASRHGIVRDERGQDQPKDKDRAQKNSGLKQQREAAEHQPQAPGEPAGGE